MPRVGRNDAVIVIPTLNEARWIGDLITFFGRDCPEIPVWVIDGGSVDQTREIVRTAAPGNPNLHLLHNPDRTQAAALNMAARRARAEGLTFLIRADAHATYPRGFARQIVATMNETGASSVSVPLISEGPGSYAAAALLQRSLLGHGGATHRRRGNRGWTQHGHHAGFRLSEFWRLGGYDTEFIAAEDVEYDLRLNVGGGSIFHEADCPVSYAPRATVTAYASQMWRNGKWRIRALRKHGRWPGIRICLPLLAFLSLPGLPVAYLTGTDFIALPALIYVLSVANAALVYSFIDRQIADHDRNLTLPVKVCLLAVSGQLAFGAAAFFELLCPAKLMRADTSTDDAVASHGR